MKNGLDRFANAHTSIILTRTYWFSAEGYEFAEILTKKSARVWNCAVRRQVGVIPRSP